jgi:hypothetical protein
MNVPVGADGWGEVPPEEAQARLEREVEESPTEDDWKQNYCDLWALD